MDDLLHHLSLRERQRLKAMRRIQSCALDLFEQHGFDLVTVEQIAETAEVSASSIYRWFGTKEQVVIWDEYDPTALAAIEAALRESSPIEAIRTVVTATVTQAFTADAKRIQRRLTIAFAHPSVEAASALQTMEMAQLIAQLLAHHASDQFSDLTLQVFSHAFAGGLFGALRHWHDSGFRAPIDEIIEAPLRALEHGMNLA